MSDLNLFLSGAIAVEFAVVGLFFLRYASKTGDNFFRYFSAAFALLAVERTVWFALGSPDELRPVIYLFRLFAFLVIIAAVLQKNRSPVRSIRQSS